MLHFFIIIFTLHLGSAFNNNNIITSPSRSQIPANGVHDIGVLLEINTLQENNPSGRMPHELAIVLDSSGSMLGDAIDFCVLSLNKIINDLIEGDILHIITYNSDATVVVENGNSKSQQQMLRKVRNIFAAGWTNMYSGLAKAINILQHSGSGLNQRMFVFSDGKVNGGQYTRTEDILSEINKWKIAHGVTVSSFGVGSDFNRQLMFNMSIVGEGDFFFIDSSDKIEKVITIAKQSFDTLIAKNTKLLLYGTRNCVLSNLYGKGGIEENTAIIDINDLRSNDIRYMVIGMRVDTRKMTNEQQLNMRDGNAQDIAILRWVLTFKSADDSFETIQHLEDFVQIAVLGEQYYNEDNANYNNDVLMHMRLATQRMNDLRILEEDTGAGNIANAVKRKTELIENIQKDLKNYKDQPGSLSDETKKVVGVELKRQKRSLEALEVALVTKDEKDIQNATLQQHYGIIRSSNASKTHEEL